MKTRRVGTLTLGVTMVFTGILYFVNMFIPAISYNMIFRAWPLVFILLGTEILVKNIKSEESVWVYDKWGIVLTMGLSLFAMFMGIMSQFALNTDMYFHI